VWTVVQSIDPDAAHANWLESFPWTRLPGSEPPAESKPMVDLAEMRVADPARVRELLGDGSYGGRYQRSAQDEAAVWQAGVEEVRDLLAGGWR
jgi:creatinine amidohydrolase